MVRPTGLRGRGRVFSMVRPTGPGGVSEYFFQWSAQRAREEFRIFFSMVRPTGPGGVSFFNGPPNGPGRGFVFQWSAQRAREGFRFSMVRPTGLRGRGRFFFQWFAQRAREGFRFSMVRPTGLRGRGRFFFNGSPNGPGRGFGFFFSMVRPTGLRGRGRFFSMVRPTGPGGVSDFFFQWSAQRAREGFRFSMVRPTGPGGVSFFNGPPNGPGSLEGFRIFFEYWSAQRAWGVSFFNGPPNPFGLPRTPNPKGTFARLWATQCYSSRVYMYVRPVRIAFLHGFARFAHASSFDWFNPLVSRAPQTQKGLSRLREFPQPAQCLKTFFSSVFARSGNSNFSAIKVFLRQKGLLQASSETRRPEECLNNHFQRLVEGPGPRRRQEVVQLPHSHRAGRVAAALRRRQRQLQQGLAPLRAADGHGVHGPQPLHVAVLRVEAPRRVRRRSEGARVVTAFTRRSVRSLLCWNLSALSCRTLNSVAGCFSTSSGAPCTVSWGRAL